MNKFKFTSTYGDERIRIYQFYVYKYEMLVYLFIS